MRKQGKILIIGIILFAGVMRTPIGMVSPLLSSIQHSLGVPAGLLGSITTIPLLCFAFFSPFVPQLGRKYGNELVMFLAVLILAVGNYFRVFSTAWLLGGTMLIGLSIAVLNVLMPVTIAQKYPQRVGVMTSLYTFSMTLFSALASGQSVVMAQRFGWQKAMQSISLLALIGMVFWLPALKGMHRAKAGKKGGSSVWKARGAWYLSLFMGLQSLLFYTTLTWVPSILVAHGLSQGEASQLFGLMQLASLVPSYVVPILAYRFKRVRGIILTMTVSFLAGIGLLMVPTASFGLTVVIVIVLGAASNIAFSLTMALFSLKTSTPEQTGDISGMAQAVGYVLAAIGPVSFGYLQHITGSWTLPLSILLVVIIVLTFFGLAVDQRETIFDD
ncbi:cyanate permease [Ligilactobacillus salitolerans]|uniref:Cyanate permease n=1 Tax=Ligilactobacillus salitolerans TaxID=1808352 RepID=A0A401IQI7_9LACO|nr:MFS transporter [Ligilactobacillus salitolerans]GBG93786.1 cyanate permease [Ligilactobacillus salitolerans]